VLRRQQKTPLPLKILRRLDNATVTESALLFTKILSYLTLTGDVLLIILAVFWFGGSPLLRSLATRFGMLAAFLVVAASALGSLFYSEVIGTPVCDLCWYQRIFMYGLVLLLGTALMRRDKTIAIYGIIFSLAGAAIAFYQWTMQLFAVYGVATLPCPSTGPSCATVYVFEFGFLTIPFMSLTAFLLTALFLAYTRRA